MPKDFNTLQSSYLSLHSTETAMTKDLNTLQSSYLSLHSTETAMTKVVNDLFTAVDSGKASILLSLDISPTFDMLDHTRLVQRVS